MSTKMQWWGVVLVCCWGAPNVAFGAPRSGAAPAKSEVLAPSPEALEKARSAFRAGTEALAAERFDDAVREFELALAVKETAGLRYYLGIAQLGAGRFRAAAVALARAKELSGDQTASDVAKVLPEAFAQLEREAPRLRLVGLPERASVRLDGESIAERDFAVDLGAHHLVIEADGFESVEADVSLVRGERRKVDVVLRPKPAPVVRAEPDEEVLETSNDAGRTVVLWTSVGVAVAGATVGVVGVVLESGAASRVAEARAAIDDESGGSLGACVNPSGSLAASCESLAVALDDQSTATTLIWGGFSGAALGLVGAVLTHYLWPTSSVVPSAEFGGDRFSLRFSGSF